MFGVITSVLSAMLCLILSGWFMHSLLPEKIPLITRYSLLMDGSLTPRQIRYTRYVTMVWALFFASLLGLNVYLIAYDKEISFVVLLMQYCGPVLIMITEYIIRHYYIPYARRPFWVFIKQLSAVAIKQVIFFNKEAYSESLMPKNQCTIKTK